MIFTYTLAESYLNQHWIETGESLPVIGQIELDDLEATQQQREKYLELGQYQRVTNLFGSKRAVALGPLQLNFLSQPKVGTVDQPVTPDSVWALVDTMLAAYPDLLSQQELVKMGQQERADAMRARLDEQRQQTQQAYLARKEAEEARRLEACHIEYKADGRAILNLKERLFLVSGDEQDHRFTNWAKEVIGISYDHADGYSFRGEWIDDGTVLVSRARRVFLVASTWGSRRYNTTTYRVILMDETGQLVRTGITTTNDTPGWALRIRDDVEALLAG